ncbi:MAG: 23S rRNA pseudouridine(1911/1915/1917) synthase RluD [Gammaproteobacteria bacterium]|nr:23S rRNA pseudouridine(1911/1915/1917) synthase RluD [Gammaproteobacteria bacterium]
MPSAPGEADPRVYERRLTAQVPDALAGMRLDRVLAELFPDYSRARLQQWMQEGRVSIDGLHPRPRDKARGGERIDLVARVEPDTAWQAEERALDVVYQDAGLLVINKPAGLVVHPAAGNRAGTLLNALLHYAPELALLPRAGIVHRLDKDTSGLLVVARTLEAHKRLVTALQARAVEREYEAIVCGVMTAGGRIDAPIGRHPTQRTRMAVREQGRAAVSHYRVLERFRAHTHVQVRLESGRTHQIRVHLAHIHHPLVGDPVYGGRLRLPPGGGAALAEALRGFRRQALHARRLALRHPASGEEMSWSAPLPADMTGLLAALRADMLQ